MLVPACRNLQWRYTVLPSAFVVCKQKVAPGDTGKTNLTALIDGATKIWKRLQSGTITVGGVKRPHNHDIAKIYQDDHLTNVEKTIIRS